MFQKIVGYLLLFFLFFTVYNTLIPFNFDVSNAELAYEIAQIEWTPFFSEGKLVSLTDIVGNVILFMPIGLLCFLYFRPKLGKIALLLSVLIGFILSFSIEFTQLFISTRNTAPHDLINNTLGAFIGAMIALVYYQFFATKVARITTDLFTHQPLSLLLICIFIAQLFTAFVPFNIAISVSAFIDNVKETNLTPFDYRPLSMVYFDGYSKTAGFQITEQTLENLEKIGVSDTTTAKLSEIVNSPPEGKRAFTNLLKKIITKNEIKANGANIMHFSIAKSEEEQFDFTQFIENIIFWIAIGFMILMAFTLYSNRLPITSWMIWVFPIVYFCIIEFGQLFISSRVSDVNDVISGSIGMYLGMLLCKLISPFKDGSKQLTLQHLWIPLCFYFLFILFSGFRPFDWSMEMNVWQKDMEIGNLIPFYAYFRKTTLWNLYDLLRSLCFFIPITAYFAYLRRKSGISFGALFTLGIISGAIVGGTIEFTQLLSVSRVAEITDVISYAIGGFLGIFAVYYYENEYSKKM